MTPPDYWPDARLVPANKMSAVVEAVRAVRSKLGLSNAHLCREVRDLIQRHNAVPGRAMVVVGRTDEAGNFVKEGKYELSAIRKGTRKYLVGYLAWLCLRDEAAAQALYEEVNLPFRPYRDGDQAEGPTPLDLGNADAVAFAEASGKEQFLVYEIAFLWYGTTPPPVQVHEGAMTPEIAQMKALLHAAIDLGKLSALQVQAAGGGFARFVRKDELQRFAHEIGIYPRFLFPDREPSPDDASAKLAELAAELRSLLLQLPKAVTDWAEEYARNEWAIYEAAFLWHGYAPPPITLHERVMPEPVRRTKLMLHDAANSNALTPAVDDGVRVRNVMVYGTRHVSRFELRRFATSIGQRPRFLFPEDQGESGTA